MVQSCDVLVIGAGIAGASLAYELSQHRSVVLLERENQPGYHSTGRSSAVFTEAYGTQLARALGAASRTFYVNPPKGFSDSPLLTPRGCLYPVQPKSLDKLNKEFPGVKAQVPTVEKLNQKAAQQKVPVLNRNTLAGALWEPDAMDMDVHAILSGFLRGVSRCNGRIVKDAEVTGIERASDDWIVDTPKGEFRAGVLVNAAGAWADQVGRMAGAVLIGLVPKRRTVILFDPPCGLNSDEWPVVIDYDEEFYFKPDAGKILASSADETPVEPCDVQPEELDIAIAAEMIEQHTSIPIKQIGHSWAGLRSFVADKSPVAGFDSHLKGFFWLAGQGGVGIITAAALARYSAGLILSQIIPTDLQDRNISQIVLSPARMQTTCNVGMGLKQRGV